MFTCGVLSSGVRYSFTLSVQMRIFFHATVLASSALLPTWCTCRPMKPEGVILSQRLAQATPLSQVRMLLP